MPGLPMHGNEPGVSLDHCLGGYVHLMTTPPRLHPAAGRCRRQLPRVLSTRTPSRATQQLGYMAKVGEPMPMPPIAADRTAGEVEVRHLYGSLVS